MIAARTATGQRHPLLPAAKMVGTSVVFGEYNMRNEPQAHSGKTMDRRAYIPKLAIRKPVRTAMRLAVATLLAVMAMSGIAVAQEEGRAVPAGGMVSEGFDPTARVAGSRIVGVGFRATTGRAFDPAQVRIAGASEVSTICVRAISRDGLYWMRTPYESAAGKTLLLSPFSLLPDRLRTYAAEEIAIYAFEMPASTSEPTAASRAADCLAAREDAGTVLPVLSAADGLDELVVLVNSGNRRVQGRLKGGAEIELRCVAFESPERIAYDQICSAQIGAPAAAPRVAELELTFDDGLTKVTMTHRVRLPGGGP